MRRSGAVRQDHHLALKFYQDYHQQNQFRVEPMRGAQQDFSFVQDLYQYQAADQQGFGRKR